MAIRIRTVLALVLILALAAIAAPSPARAVANMGGDAQLSCAQIGPTNHAPFEATIWATAPGIHVSGDSWIQVMKSTNCVWYVRVKVNIYSAASDDPRNFGYDGQLNLRQNGVDVAATPVYVGSAGEDGITSIYSEWEPRVCGKWYTAAGWTFAIAHNYTWYSIGDWWANGAQYDAPAC